MRFFLEDSRFLSKRHRFTSNDLAFTAFDKRYCNKSEFCRLNKLKYKDFMYCLRYCNTAEKAIDMMYRQGRITDEVYRRITNDNIHQSIISMCPYCVWGSFWFSRCILPYGAYTRMRRALNDILYYVTLVVFWIIFPTAFVICFGFGIGLILILCMATVVMDVIALIIGESENG